MLLNTRVFLCFIICFLFIRVQAQTISVPVIVQSNKQPVTAATVQAWLLSDTINKQQKITDNSGIATFSFQLGKPYTISVSSIGYQPVVKNLTISNSQSININLITAAANLGGVVVTSTRPLIRQEDDKTIVDPENLASQQYECF